ncbi:MAG: DUF1015 family protein [Atribacterota bacterium]
MKNIKAFYPLIYNPDKTDITTCIAPPYDMFNYGDTIDNNLRKYPHNIVHIQKPLGKGDSKYHKALEIKNNFIKDKILIKEKKKGIFILKQKWQNFSRLGIIAAVKLDENYKRIRKHEDTKSGPIKDRLKLTKSIGMNIGSIFVVFEDINGKIDHNLNQSINKDNLVNEFIFPQEVKNSLYFLKGDRILKLLQDKILYIADGHHRYQTMLQYRNFMRKKHHNKSSNYEHTMMFLVPDKEIVIFPYHRLIRNIRPELIKNLINNLKNDFDISHQDNISMPQKNSIGMVLDKGYFILTPINKTNEMLDSELLHKSILEPYLGITKANIRDSDYVHFKPGNEDINEISYAVKTKKYQAGFILNPPSFKQIKNISDNSKTMPPKSTYFFPKVPTGIVMYETV